MVKEILPIQLCSWNNRAEEREPGLLAFLWASLGLLSFPVESGIVDVLRYENLALVAPYLFALAAGRSSLGSGGGI